MLTLWRFADK